MAADNLLATLLTRTAFSCPLIPPATQVTENYKSYLVVAFDVGDMINGNNKYGNISGALNI